MFQSNCRLREINLAMNGFGDEGALAVAELLKRSTTLHVIDISFNRISQIGATAIGKALDQNDALRTLRDHIRQEARFTNKLIFFVFLMRRIMGLDEGFQYVSSMQMQNNC